MGSALIVPGAFRPEYQFVNDYLGNHTFRVTPRADGTYEYLIAGAWSEGAVLKTWDTFQQYVVQTALEYESPLRIRFVADEVRR